MGAKKLKIFISCVSICLVCAGSVCAMELDGIKAHFLKGEWKDAIREGETLLGQAKRDSPDLDQLYYYLALCYMKDRNFLRTSDICEIILKEFPSSRFVPQAHYVLIDAYASSGNYGAAQANAESYLKKYRGNEHARDVETRLIEFKSKTGSQYIAKQAAPVSAPVPVPVQDLTPVNVQESAPAPVAAVVLGQDESGMDIVLAPELSANSGRVANAGSFWIQVGAFSNGRNADNLAAKLRAASYATAVSPSAANGKSIYKVRVGPYYAREDAQAVSLKLSRQGYPTKVIP